MSFSEKVTFITGAGGGIGAAVARYFAREGSRVFITDVNEGKAKQVEKAILESGGSCAADRLDVANPEEVKCSVSRCRERFGGIDILVNCAGILTLLPFDEITPDLWDATLDVNAKGTFLVCQEVAKQMIAQGRGGKMVNISSVAGKIGAPYYTHYCASKFAVIGITKSLALELAKHRINVNAVCPGDVETEMFEYELRTHARFRKSTVEEIKSQLTNRVPLGRLAVPEDVANVISFLASDKASYMTGQALNISGGTIAF